MLQSAASQLGLHCSFWPVCPNTYGKYGTTVTHVLAYTQITKNTNNIPKITLCTKYIHFDGVFHQKYKPYAYYIYYKDFDWLCVKTLILVYKHRLSK